MSKADSREAGRPWVRDVPDVTGPERSAGGFYRTAERRGSAPKGVSMNRADDAVVAAVRMAYKVAEAQVARSGRLARKLRDAGDRAVGPHSDRQALDATERLVFRTMMSGLSWLESAAAERDSPIKRLLDAQYRILGTMMGMTPAGDKVAATPPPTQTDSRRDTQTRGDTRATTRAARSIAVKHVGKHRRMVRIVDTDIGQVSAQRTAIAFYNARRPDLTPIDAVIIVRSRGEGTLEIAMTPDSPPGRWRAAICDGDGAQVGSLEIVI